MEFGSLESIPLRDAWPNEARDFTPWLAKNLELLSDVLGLRLELRDREVSVDTFSADILAHDSRDDTAVLIENQLDSSDHTHLGQILTYLAGLEAKTVIWIAQDFSEAHLSAVRWLNDHTDDQYSFFAVQVRAVRIGNSPVAPVLEIREKPSSWDRQLRQVKLESESELSRFRREFWEYYVECFPKDINLKPGYRHSNVWYKVDGTDLIISQFLSPSTRRVGAYVRSQAEESRKDIEERLGLGNNKLYSELIVDPMDREEWETIANWLHDTMVSFRNILEGDSD